MTFCVGPRRLRGYLLSFTVSKSTFLRPQDRLDQRFDRRRAGSAIDVRLAAHDIFVCVRKRAGRRDVDPLETDLQRAPLCRARCAANGTVVERNGSISGVPVATPVASPGSYMPEITAICPCVGAPERSSRRVATPAELSVRGAPRSDRTAARSAATPPG